MDKILLISDNVNSSQKFSKIFAKNTFDFFILKDELMILDSVTVYPPDIIILDINSDKIDFKNILKKIKSLNDNIIIIIYTNNKFNNSDLVKYSNAFIPDEMSDKLILSTIKMNLKSKKSLDKLSATNKDLADSLYRLNALYDTSSKLAGTLDKKKLLDFMIEGMDKSLSFSLTCLLSFCEETPVLFLNSLYELSDEIIEAIKFRTILNYKTLFDNKKLPYELNESNLKIIKNVKYPASRFTFTLFQYDNMFAPISLGNDFFGCIEIFKDDTFIAEDATCFQTIVRQVTLPLKGATLYQELIQTNKELEKLERLKSDFISIVSHELRTPLTSIKNALNILASGKCVDLTENAERFLSMAQRNVVSLTRIINDLLDLSKIEAGKMEFNFKECNIQTVIDYVKSSLTGVAKSKNINLNVEDNKNLPSINADSQRLEQVLSNLVSNAIKFTPENRNIYIRTEIQNSKDLKVNPIFENDIKHLNGECVIVTVEDEGIGIAEKDLKKAFDKFAQIENSLSRKVGGTGLGLPIAKQLLEAHSGAIWCDSTPNKGSKFYFAIPVMKVGVPV